jgi:hypothetical protein
MQQIDVKKIAEEALRLADYWEPNHEFPTEVADCLRALARGYLALLAERDTLRGQLNLALENDRMAERIRKQYSERVKNLKEDLASAEGERDRYREALEQLAEYDKHADVPFPEDGNYEDFARYYYPDVLAWVRNRVAEALAQPPKPEPAEGETR